MTNYAIQDYKTEKQLYASGINCLPQTARQEMLQTKKQFNKEDGIIAFHAYQSFKPGEVTPDLAHQIGLELANELWGDRFQVLVATHLDKAHIHNHFVLKEDLRKLDEISRQTILLMNNNIETDEQLQKFIADKEAEIQKLCAERKTLNSKLYKLPKESADKLRVKRDSLTNKIAELRNELKTVQSVVKRKYEIKQKLKAIIKRKREHNISNEIKRRG